MKTFFQYIFPAILVFIGTILGVYATSYWGKQDWRSKTLYENQRRLFDERLKLVERTSNITSKLPAAKDMFTMYFDSILDTVPSQHLNQDQKIMLAEKLASIRSELWSTMLLNQMYFGDSTRKQITDILSISKTKYWWDIPEADYNKIIGSMTWELNNFSQPISKQNLVEEPMSDGIKIIWTAIATLIGGVIIYVFGRIIEKFIIEPLYEYKRTLANISDSLMYYANIYSNPQVSTPEDKREAIKAVRKLASDLNAKTHQLAFQKFFAKLKVIPTYSNSMDAVSTLIGFSNTIGNSGFEELERRQKRLRTLLKIAV